jgi:hypothetical protein
MAQARIPLGAALHLHRRGDRAGRGGRRHLARALHAVRPHRLRDRRQRAVGAADGPAGARTKIAVYTLSGFCSALGGVLFTFYMLSGYGLHAVGLELDAIAAVVIGGTLLTGGVGLRVRHAARRAGARHHPDLITFDGTLSSWWTKICCWRTRRAKQLSRESQRHAGYTACRWDSQPTCAVSSWTDPSAGCEAGGDTRPSDFFLAGMGAC